MTLTKQGNFTFNHVDQQDDIYKVKSATEIKQAYDSRANELKATFNNLIDALKSSIAGDSGAKSIGVETISGLSGNDVQSLLQALKNQIDSTVLGTVPDGSITDQKLSVSSTSSYKYAVATGSANTYAITLNPAPTSYYDGMPISVKINVDATGISTINVNGLGSKGLKKASGADMTNSKANGVYNYRYNATTGNFILQGEGGSGTATAGDILAGKTASADTGDVTGAMVNRGAMTITPGTTDQIIPVGYHDGTGKVVGDADLIAANIASGINIFGVVGTVQSFPNLNVGTAQILVADTIQSGSQTTPTKIKEIKINYTGTVYVYYDSYTGSGTNPAITNIYKNGVAVGTQRSNTSTTSVTYTESITVQSGDLIQLYKWSSGNAYNTTVKNFRIGIDGSPFGVINLN